MKNFWTEQLNTLKQQLEAVDIHLTLEQMTLLEQYLHLLVSWNERTNLVSKNDVQHLVDRHLLESIAVLTASCLDTNALVMDLGSGAGFPGIPLKILRSDLDFKFIDSKRMKYLFLKEVIRQLDLKKAEAMCVRVEDLHATFLNYFDFIVCRAVATLVELWDWSAKFLKKEGKLLAMKGGDLTSECAEFRQNFPETNLQIIDYPETLGLLNLHKKLVIITKEH